MPRSRPKPRPSHSEQIPRRKRHQRTGSRGAAKDSRLPPTRTEPTHTGPTRREDAIAQPGAAIPVYSPPGEGTPIPDVAVTISKRRPSEVRITGYLPLRMYGDEDVSWRVSHPGRTKIVPLTLLVDRKHLRDLAAAAPSDEFRQIFFVPAYLKAGPKPRGLVARGAKITPLITALARQLRVEIETDPELRRRVRDRADNAGGGIRSEDIRDLVAYMVEEVWGESFDQLRLRRPLADVEAFAKRYLPRRQSVEVEARERTPRFLDLVHDTILRFDPTYLRRLIKRFPVVEDPGLAGGVSAEAKSPQM